MLNNRLFCFLGSLCLMLPTTQAFAQDHVEFDSSQIQSVMPLKQSVEQQQASQTEASQKEASQKEASQKEASQTEASQTEASQKEEAESPAYDYVVDFPETASLGYRKAINAFYGAAKYEDWPSLKKFIDPVKPVLLMAITYGNEERGYTSSDDSVSKMFVESGEYSMLDVLLSISAQKPACQSLTCWRPGMHFSDYTDHFIWNEKSQKLLWVGTVYRAFWGEYDAENDRERLDELRRYDKQQSHTFDKAVKKFYGRSAKK